LAEGAEGGTGDWRAEEAVDLFEELTGLVRGFFVPPEALIEPAARPLGYVVPVVKSGQ